VFDEIQSCERALTSLKYFCEETPEYHIAAAGSLLGVAINRKNYSFPVGKVETLTLYPLDFEEFLWARNQDILCEEIKKSYESLTEMVKSLHQQATDLYREYLIIGGMPGVLIDFYKQENYWMFPWCKMKF
ncbi:MAG: AAA family ATPase, partial [Clostridiales bacterium]